MDVTNGLISRLVKSKSTERVLAPIASQVSLLMILNEVDGEPSADGSVLNVNACLERVTVAVDRFVKVGQDQIHRSCDPLFDSQMTAACETLELAKSQLYVAGQTVSGTPGSGYGNNAVVSASKDLLQAVLRVLVVVDDVEVRRCVQAVSAVEVKVRNIGSVSSSSEMVSGFKELTEALLYMTMLISRRQKDLVSASQGDELMAGLNLMRKGVSSLRMAVQTHLKYPNNSQALAGKQQVVDHVLSTLTDMRSTLESGPPSELDVEEAGHFVDHIDKVLENLGEGSRFELSGDLESWVASLIRHAMGVAHLCQGSFRHLISRTCQRILQSKFRLFELQGSIAQNLHLSEIRLDYEGVCEVLLDEFCELEKHVNMALLNLIIDTCCFTSQPLEHLATTAIHQQDELGPDIGQSVLAQEFVAHGDKLCHVAAMASASTMDPRKVRAVKLAASYLEQLLPEVVPAVGAVARHPGNVAAVRHLKDLVQQWEKETGGLVRTLDSMTDPAVFLHVTEQRMRQGVNVVRGKVSEHDAHSAKAGLRMLLAHARRMVQVATRVVTNSCDAVFRNGLMVFVQQMEAARHGVKEASRAALEDLSHSRVVDTLHRRLGLLLDGAADLRQGVKGDNHVDLLHPARRNVRRQHLLSDKPSTGERVALANQQVAEKATNKEDNRKAKAKPPLHPSTADKVPTVNVQPVSASVSATTSSPAKLPGALGVSPESAAAQSKASCPEGEDPEEGAAKKRGKESASKSHRANQSRGEVSAMLETCGDQLVAAAMGRDSSAVARCNGDVLGWTSHLGEVSLSLLEHCHHAARKSEMHVVTEEMDRLAPLVIETARFVAAGDTTQASSLRLLVDDWVSTCNKLRILVDVATGDWLLLMEQVWQAVTAQDSQALKPLLSIVDRNQREMSRLLTRAKSLEGRHMSRGTDIVRFFQDAQPEVENLTVTVKTSADCIAMTGDKVTISRTQLIQRGREWCALMTCLVSELDFVADTLSARGQVTLGVPAVSVSQGSSIRTYTHLSSKVVPLLQAETARLKDILACFTTGGEAAVRERSEELSQALTSIMEEVVEIAQTPVDDATLPQAQLFGRLDAGLARSRWTEKALEAEQFVQRQCTKFSVLIHNLLVPTGLSPDAGDIVPAEVAQLQTKLKVVSQRVLQALQLSPDLQQRGTVRRCLDDLTSMLPVISQAATDCASGLDREKSEREVQKAATKWGAKVHCLMATLRSMSDIKPSLINELERHLSAQPLEMAASAPTVPSGIQQTSLSSYTPTAITRTHAASTHTPGKTHTPTVSIHAPNASTHTLITRQQAPVVHTQGASSLGDGSRLFGTPTRGSDLSSGKVTESQLETEASSPAMAMSPYRRSALYTSWLASAQYLGEEVAGWEDSDNPFVQIVHTMAQHCQHMADFSHGGTSLKDSEEVAKTGLSLAASGQELEKFAHSLLAISPSHRHTGELQRAADKIASCCKQLHIVASVLHNAPGHPQGDCILARNAANLVEAVRLMFSVAEGVAVAGLLEPREGNDTDRQVVDLLTRWQKKLAAYRVQQTNITEVDELGLRRMEVHNPPSLTTLVDG